MGKTVGLIRILIMLVMLVLVLAEADAQRRDSVPQLPTVQLRARGAGVHVRNDTVEYDAAKYASPDLRKVRDLLARLEGFSVGADGRIFVNGQEIETILLNGEDLTGANYRLLSNYLRSGLVKKVQVIRDWDADPLRKELRRSGKLGLSLVLYDSLSRSWSGGVDAGLSQTGRKDMDLHFLRLQERNKYVALAQANGTGLTITGNRDFYARESADETVHDQKTDLATPSRVSEPVPPPLPDAYVQDNDDASASLILKHRLEAGRQLGLVLGMDQVSLIRSQQRDAHYAMPDGSAWFTRELDRSGTRDQRFLLQGEYTDRRGTRAHTRIWLDLFAEQRHAEYAGTRTGAVLDKVSVHDRWRNEGLTLRWSQTRKRTDHAWTMDGELGFIREQQRFSGQWAVGGGQSGGGWQLDSFNQRWHSGAWRSDVTWRRVPLRKPHASPWVFRYQGLLANRQVIRLGADSVQGRMALARQSITAGKDWERKQGRNARWMGQLYAGPGLWQYAQDGRMHVAMVHETSIGFQRQSGPFRAWSIVYRDARSLPDDRYVLPAGMMTGRQTMIQPQLHWAQPWDHSLGFTMHARSLSAGAGYFLMMRLGWHDQVVMPAIQMDPNFTRIIPVVMDHAADAHVGLSGDAFVPGWNLKLSGNLHYTSRIGQAITNGVVTRRRMDDAGAGVQLSTAAKGKIHAEMSYQLDRHGYQDKSGLSAQAFHNWSQQARCKLRAVVRSGFNMVVAAEWNHSPGLASFVALDLNASWRWRERWEFMLLAHDLLNRRVSMSTWVDAGSHGETMYRLVPGYLLVKVSWALG